LQAPDPSAPESTPRLLIVILNYRTPALTLSCLRSLARQIVQLPDAEVVVTDNDSGDGSAELIARGIADEGMSSWARCVALPRNGGYAYGNNAPVREALQRANPPDHVLLLNPDTEVLPGAVQALRDFMRTHPECAIAGSRLEDTDGTVHCSAFNFPSMWSELDRGLQLGVVSRLLRDKVIYRPIPEAPTPVDWVAGASMMVRREVFEQVGLIDEAYFLYFEEVDFLLRAHRAGYQTWYVPASRVIHHMGASTGVTDIKKAPRRIPTYWFESRRRYFVRNHGVLHAAAADLFFLAGNALRRVRSLVSSKQRRPDPPSMMADYVRNSVLLRGARLDAPLIR